VAAAAVELIPHALPQQLVAQAAVELVAIVKALLAAQDKQTLAQVAVQAMAHQQQMVEMVVQGLSLLEHQSQQLQQRVHHQIQFSVSMSSMAMGASLSNGSFCETR
jgi:hypothetical protein